MFKYLGKFKVKRKVKGKGNRSPLAPASVTEAQREKLLGNPLHDVLRIHGRGTLPEHLKLFHLLLFILLATLFLAMLILFRSGLNRCNITHDHIWVAILLF